MALVTGSEFARMAGVSKAAVSKAQQSKIFKNENGKIDTENPINAVYLAEHSEKAKGGSDQIAKANKKPPKTGIKKQAESKQEIQAKKKPESKKQNIETEETEDHEDELTDEEKKEMIEGAGIDMIEWTLRGKKAIALFREAGERRLNLNLMERKGELIERTQFITAVQGINKAIDDHLHRLPAKLGPVLYAIARQEGGNELAVVRELEKGMGDAIRRAVDDIANLKPTGAATIAP